MGGGESLNSFLSAGLSRRVYGVLEGVMPQPYNPETPGPKHSGATQAVLPLLGLYLQTLDPQL